MTDDLGFEWRNWQARVDALWETISDDTDPDEFIGRMDALAAERPGAIALFEQGGSRDSMGRPAEAVVLYEQAIEQGLPSDLHRQATIQLASSIRNLGDPARSIQLLAAERWRISDELDDAVDVFLALAMADLGRERQALALVVTALAPHLARYSRSAKNYAQALITPESGE
ncbi:tetratricopeptide repeat protein [Naasia lichenicola]|uniref:Tetratricopeptide repeat protein n=2 Tax=Naasia lichenicola TaxID=2565933 RepID=A0A4S4FDH5_9MICO|nr:tetratricopeptide repeat protein [Naasia lichenicola]